METIETELSLRNKRIRTLLQANRLDGLIVTNQQNFEYFTGFRSLFWASAARPFFAVITADSETTHVICASIETRNAEYNPGNCEFIFYKGFIEDALGNLSSLLRSVLPASPRVALDYGEEIFGRGSLALNGVLADIAGAHETTEAGHLIWNLRCVKSEYEIARKRTACKIATDSFFEVLPSLQLGKSERDFAQALSCAMYRRGAESIDWLPVRFGTGKFPGTRHPTDRPLAVSDFIWTDMGCGFEGYLSDLNRIAKAGEPTVAQQSEYTRIRDLTLAFAQSIRAGMTCEDAAREYELLSSGTRTVGGPAGRLAHGSGMGLTEPPSIMMGSNVQIEEGMVLHVEPRSEVCGGVFQLEEVFVVRAGGIEFLSEISPPELPFIHPDHVGDKAANLANVS